MAGRVEGNSANGGTGVGLGDEQIELHGSTSNTSLAQAVNDRLNQQGYTPSSQRKGGAGYDIEEVPESCCQKVGDCFRGYFSTNKTKTHTQ